MKSVALPAFAAAAALVAFASRPAAAQVTVLGSGTSSSALYANLYAANPDESSPSVALMQSYMPSAGAAGTGSMSQDLGDDAVAPLNIQGAAVTTSSTTPSVTSSATPKAEDKPVVDLTAIGSLPSPVAVGDPNYGADLEAYLQQGMQAFLNSEAEQNGGAKSGGAGSDAGTGNDATPNNIPEPSSAAVVLILAAGALARRRA